MLLLELSLITRNKEILLNARILVFYNYIESFHAQVLATCKNSRRRRRNFKVRKLPLHKSFSL